MVARLNDPWVARIMEVTKPVKPIKLNKKQTLRIRTYAAREQITVSQAIDQALNLLEEHIQSERSMGGVTPDELATSLRD